MIIRYISHVIFQLNVGVGFKTITLKIENCRLHNGKCTKGDKRTKGERRIVNVRSYTEKDCLSCRLVFATFER